MRRDGARRSGWDFALMMATVVVLAALGIQSFLGTAYAWWGERTQLDWTVSGYPAFVDVMNAVAGPLVVALVVLLGLCVPKRVFERRALLAASVALVAVGLVAWAVTGKPAVGLGAYLLAASAFQLVALVLTLGRSGSLTYLTEGHLVRVGSSLLHLGFLLFAYVVVALQSSPWMLPVFWVAAGLLTAGSAMSFYARPLGRRAPTRPDAVADAEPTAPR